MRYRPLAQDPQEMALGMLYMRRYDIGVFKSVRTIDGPDGGIERFDTWFTDDTASTKSLVVPWNGFGRANVRGEFIDILKGPLPSTGFRSVTFIIGDTGPGVLRIRRLALTPGHPQLGWPLHSAVERRSLPPLQ